MKSLIIITICTIIFGIASCSDKNDEDELERAHAELSSR
mgnify:CR=1 FL=1